MPAAVLLIDIQARLASLEASFADAKKKGKSFADDFLKQFTSIKSVSDVLRLSIAGVSAGFVANKVFDDFQALKTLVEDSERSVNQLNAVLKATGGGAGQTPAALDALNKSLQGSTVFNEDQIRQAETALLRFRTIQGDTFNDALKLVPDVAAALGKDLPSAAEALGRALS